MMECPHCNNRLLTASRMIDDFHVDEEPYKSGIKEDGKIMQGNFNIAEEIMVIIQYCETCDKVISRCFEDGE